MEKHYSVEKIGKYSYDVKADEGYKIVLREADAEKGIKAEYSDHIQCNDKYIETHLKVVKM